MPSLQILKLEERLIQEECEGRRKGWEQRYGRRNGCDYDCDEGFHEVLFSELGWDHLAFADVVFPHGLALFACECNSRLVRVDNRFESVTIRPFQKTAA